MNAENITTFIKDWAANISNNEIEPESHIPAFDTPLIGIAKGDDELFTFLKNDIGKDFYWTPIEAYSQAFPNDEVVADELSVIGWILPHTEKTRKAHRLEKELPSREWSLARHYGVHDA